ncbi:ABC transporter substrate-binding protein [Candidatus Poribacteria bacterium]|nr:ABC transporter substrate-binding protein [Candidatus Poribacteria bacterium]
MTYQGMRRIFRDWNKILFYTVNYLALVMGVLLLFAGCENVQQLLAPMPAEDNDGTIKIGFMYTSDTRSNSLNGAELAALQLNGEGGAHGREIEIIAHGNISDTEQAAVIAEELIIQERVSVIVGPNRSNYAVVIGPVAQRYGIPMVTTTATNPSVTAAGDFVFMAAFTDDFQGKVMATFATQDLGAKTAAVLTCRESLYSEGLSQTFIDNFTALGGEVVHAQFYMRGDTDFTAQLTAIAEAAPDVFFLPGFAAEIPLVVQQAKTLSITGILLGGDSWDNSVLISENSEILEGSFFSSLFSADVTPGDLSEDADQFITAYTSIFQVPPAGGAALGYDGVRLVVQAMRRADDLKPVAIRDQLAATMDYNGATFISGYDENRHPNKSAVINQIVNGEAQFYKLIEP